MFSPQVPYAENTTTGQCYFCDSSKSDQASVTDPRECITLTTCDTDQVCYAHNEYHPGSAMTFRYGCQNKYQSANMTAYSAMSAAETEPVTMTIAGPSRASAGISRPLKKTSTQNNNICKYFSKDNAAQFDCAEINSAPDPMPATTYSEDAQDPIHVMVTKEDNAEKRMKVALLWSRMTSVVISLMYSEVVGLFDVGDDVVDGT
ncbi:hypothetical protein DPMN_154402 [Dreissena polymorpha]|uniref:Uncharacterized protein n=1 Tax=Dreissena polymorpha TaxID=45954 RepID=A0A9D4FQQ2_DREPO|nr:hypothetical protein DPMN_154402 [Dreissena polymorpha]